MADPDGTIRNPAVESQSGSTFLEDMALVIGVPLVLVLIGSAITMAVYSSRLESSASDKLDLAQDEAPLEAEMIMEAEMVTGPDDGSV